MKDVMQVARTRKADLEAGIEKREAEISDMREEIETLDEFMAYGSDLLQRSSGPGETAEEKQPDVKPQFEMKAAESVEEAVDADDDVFDTMADDDQLAKSIAQLRPRSRPISRPA